MSSGTLPYGRVSVGGGTLKRHVVDETNAFEVGGGEAAAPLVSDVLDLESGGFELSAGLASAGGRGEGTVQAGGADAGFGREAEVARTEGESAGFANCGAGDDFSIDEEFLGEFGDELELLEILLAEVSAGSANEVEEFKDDGEDAGEVAGSKFAFENGWIGGFDAVAVAVRVEIGGRGDEDVVGPECGEKAEIGVEGVWVAGKVARIIELGGIDEYGDDRGLIFGAGALDECGVSRVEGAHCGNEANGASGEGGALDLPFGEGAGEDHQ